MTFSYITLFPELIRHYLSDALLFKAEQKHILKFSIHQLRDYAIGNYKSVDDTVYGGGDGMVFEIEPLVHCLESIKKKISSEIKTQVIYLSPQGQKCDHQKILELLKYDHLIFVCGRYAGIDQRFIANYIDQEISIGDYVLSGGELPSLVLTEAISRQIPNVLGDHKSAEEDSFSDSLQGFLEAPQFTKPQNYNEQIVPDVLTSGHHLKISDWKKKISILVTLAKRPDLLEKKTNINWLELSEFYKKLTLADQKTLQINDLEERIKMKLSQCSLRVSHDRK